MVWYIFALPNNLFDVSYSTVVEDNSGKLLGAHIASDEQWRFPKPDSLPQEYINAVLTYEDQQFYQHPGVNPFSIYQALVVNIKAGHIVRGGSTITMQVIRLSGKNPPRTVFQKVKEILLATRLELAETKNEILLTYAAHAPFGGNVVGIEAACWRYFGRPLHDLTQAEYAMLAVLPNNPALIHPGKNRIALKQKRDRLLEQLWHEGFLDSTECYLSRLEPLPEKPQNMPTLASHVTARFSQTHKGQRIKSTLNAELQKQVLHILKKEQQKLIANQVYNVGVVVAKIETGEVVAYVGNGPSTPANQGVYVDVTRAPRSTGSILKPFLFQAMLNEGQLLPNMLIADVPLHLQGFHPKNYNKSYDGAVPASMALTRSLNVPFVLLLRDFGINKFKHNLQKWGLTTLNKKATHYGLTLILGGAEATLWDLTTAYRKLAFTALGSGKSTFPAMHINSFAVAEDNLPKASPGSAYITLETIKNLNRPSNEVGWKIFSGKNVAWKTGTSFGHRDAWAIGVTPKYVVGVWVGNANGEGRSVLTGVDAAAPILFEIYNLLDNETWFEPPYGYLEKIEVCAQSGYPASVNCTETKEELKISGKENYGSCPYHKKVFLDEFEQYRVNANCYPVDKMRAANIFVLPPIMAKYYGIHHLDYVGSPPWRLGCNAQGVQTSLQIIYPSNNQVLVPTKNLQGKKGEVVFRAAHRNPAKVVFWHVDDEFVGSTQHFHELAINLKWGKHTLYLVDEDGNEVRQNFEVKGE